MPPELLLNGVCGHQRESRQYQCWIGGGSSRKHRAADDVEVSMIVATPVSVYDGIVLARSHATRAHGVSRSVPVIKLELLFGRLALKLGPHCLE